MRAIAHGGCTDTATESPLDADPGRKIPCCTGYSGEPASVLRLAFESEALPALLLVTFYKYQNKTPRTRLISSAITTRNYLNKVSLAIFRQGFTWTHTRLVIFCGTSTKINWPKQTH